MATAIEEKHSSTDSTPPLLYPTQRMNFAAALIALGHELKDVKKSGETLTFVFEDDGRMAERYKDYLTGVLAVSAIKFINAQDSLRELRNKGKAKQHER